MGNPGTEEYFLSRCKNEDWCMLSVFSKVLVSLGAVGLMASVAHANVSGYVKNVSNVGVGGVSVSLLSSGTTAITDANGYFSIAAGNLETAAMNASVSAPSFEGGLLYFTVAKTASVQISTYGMLGQKVFHSNRQMMNSGVHSVNAIPNNANPGIYLVKVNVDNSEYTYKINYKGLNNRSTSVEKVGLRKALVSADSLVFQYNGETLAEKVPVLDDDASVGNVIISRKVVSGAAKSGASVNVSLQGSLGENISLTASAVGGKYEASSGWMIYRENRNWNVSASAVGTAVATQMNVSDDVQAITLNLMEVFFSSSSSAVSNSSSSIVSSSSSNVIPSSTSVIPSVVEGSSGSVAVETKYLNYSATLEISSTDYSSVTVDLGASQVASALGIDASQLSSVTYYAVNPDGSANNTASTANDPGHWFNTSGNVTTYDGGSASIYSEMNLSSMTANVGQYPGVLSAGSYTIKQGVSYGNKSVVFTITLTMKNTAVSSSSSSSAKSSSSSVLLSSSSISIPIIAEGGSTGGVVLSSSSVKSSASVTTITMASLATSNPEIYKFVNWQWEYRLSSNGIVSGADGTYDDYRTENSSGLTFEHIINGNGTLKYCVVWEKKSALSKSKRDQIRQMINEITHAWTKYLTGFEGWPYDNVNVVATGWAVYDASYIEDKQSDENVYTSTKTDGMVGEYYTLNFGGNIQPYCPDGTYDEIFQVVDGYTSYSTNSWGFAGGGLWVAAEHVESMLGVGIPHIVAHESGHNFGLPDYYESWDFPDANYSSPKVGNASGGGITANTSYSGIARSMVMNAGSSSEVTEYDYWLLRKFWYETKHKYGY